MFRFMPLNHQHLDSIMSISCCTKLSLAAIYWYNGFRKFLMSIRRKVVPNKTVERLDPSTWVRFFFVTLLFTICSYSLLFPGGLPYEFKVVIAGNHELTFDKDFMAELVKQDYYRFPSVSKLKPEDFDNVQSLLTNCVYLQDSDVTIKGFRIYGAPW